MPAPPSPTRRILVTSALPYANGAIHLGHLVEYIQTDIWVRFQNMRGHKVYYVCADDTHGTPVMLRAQQEGITPEQLIERMHTEHARDFADFGIGFDNYYTTHSPENRALAESIYKKLRAAGHIAQRKIKQAYDPVKNMFLPDRFIRGECPRCGAKDQYGDSCEVCGATYSPTELKNAVSALSGATPIEKESEHYFFKLGDFEKFLADFTHSGALQQEVANKLDEWFTAGLKDWDISRDTPYFGFEIPDAPGKYFYVWLDAPIGYMASFQNLCEKKGLDFDAFWGKESTAELYHFIGKDILYFHSLFWPAMLEGAGYRKPTKVFAHGFLTINGQKMSKSRGTFINARDYLDHLNPEYLRYYFAAKLGSGIEDIDLNFDDFVARVNSDLVGKYVNIASRTAGFVTRLFDGNLPWPGGQTRPLVEWYKYELRDIADSYEGRRYQEVVRAIMRLADEINREFDAEKPWARAKDPTKTRGLGQLCTIWLERFRLLSIALHPILPALTGRVARELFGMDRDFVWSDVDALPARINPYQHLAARIDSKAIDALLGKASAATEAPNLPSPSGRGAGGEGSRRSKTPLPEELREFARRLRTQQTDAENLVWLLLRDRRVHDAKFRRQHPFESPDGRFVLDFYCHEAKLAVELDGGQHQDRAPKDDSRTRVLERGGIHVLRFWNNDVLADTASVMEAIWNVLEERLPMTMNPSPPTPLPEGEGSKAISIDDFSKVDLRIARIVDAKYVEGADKLLQLTVDIGDEKSRNIFAGIRAAYDPEKLKGRLTVVVANLAPRKMKFGVSEGMVLAAGPGGKDLWILSPDDGAQPGMRVK